MKKGKKKDKEEGEAGDAADDGEDSSDPEVDSDEGEGNNHGQESTVAPTKAKKDTIPYSKEELLKKLEQMKLALENGEEDFEDFDDDDDFFGSDYDDSGEEEEEEEEEKPVKKGVTFDKGVKK